MLQVWTFLQHRLRNTVMFLHEDRNFLPTKNFLNVISHYDDDDDDDQ